jgi:ribonucleotide reductase alpha subunit
MKQRVAVTAMAVLLMAGTTAAAQPGYFSTLERHRSADLQKAACQYAHDLKSGNEGVTESAIAHVIRMKLFVPDLSCPELEMGLRMLAVTGDTPAVRHRAYLATLVFDSPALFKEEAARTYESPDEIFRSVASRVNIAVLEPKNK